MTGFKARRWAAAALFATLPLAALPARAAAEREATLNYAIYVGGFETIRIAFHTALGPADYRMKMSLDGLGVLDWWFSWTMSAFSEGRLAGGAVVPVRAGAQGSWRGKHWRMRLSYDGAGPPIAVIKPPPDEDDDRDPVPHALRAGARDLAGAVLAGMSRLDASLSGDGGCAVREAVFDGRRRYDLVLGDLGRDVLQRNGYSPFSGPALRCRVKIDRIAGFRRDAGSSRWRRSDDGATLWIGRVFAGFPPVPVRMELETPFGGLRAYLVGATMREGSRSQSLAQAR